jgi:hypothetical protein
MTTAFGQRAEVFRPTQIAGCVLWLDGADPAGTGVAPANGATISTWTDKSGNGRNATTTAGTLTYSLASKSIVFNGSSYYSLPNNTFPTGNNAYSIIIVSSSTLADYHWIIGGGVTTSGQAVGCVYYPTGIIENGWWTTNIQTSTGIATANKAGIIHCFYDSTTLTTFFDGVSRASSSSLGSRNSPSGPNLIGARLDSSAGNVIQSLVGNIYEILVFNSGLQTAQRQQIEGYLAWKWGLVANLPSSHPYKQTPLYQLPPLPLVPAPTRITQQTIFSPTQLSGCSLWYDAADTSRLTRSGSSVTNWTSKGTNAIALTNASNYPTYVSNAYNRLGTLRFTFATNQSLSNASVANSVVQTNTTHTIFLVHNPNANNSTPFGFLDSTGIESKRISAVTPESSNIPYDVGGRLSYSYASQAAYLNGTLKLETFTVSGGNRFYRRDGTQLATNGTISSSFNANQILYIGGADPSYANYKYGGDYCEIVWFNRDLTTLQIQQIEGYLAWKWGVQANLPSNHPYKNTPLYALSPLPSQTIPRIIRQERSYMIETPLWFSFGIPTSNFSSSLPISLAGSASYTGNILQLTPNSASQRGSAFFQRQLRIINFSTQFTLRFDSTRADGATFCIQNSSSNALGTLGGNLGYGGITNSVAIRFDTWNGLPGGEFSTDVLTGGSVTTDLGGSGVLNTTFGLTGGTTWNFLISIAYNGTTLSYTIRNFNNLNQSFTSNRTINLGTTIGSSNAWIGFTSATGGATEVCSILSWNWSNGR